MISFDYYFLPKYLSSCQVLIQTSTLSAKVVHEDDNFLKIGTSNVIRKIKFKSERGGLEGISINNNVRLKAVSGLGNGNFVTYSKPITSIWRNLKNKCGFGYSIIIRK